MLFNKKARPLGDPANSLNSLGFNAILLPLRLRFLRRNSRGFRLYT